VAAAADADRVRAAEEREARLRADNGSLREEAAAAVARESQLHERLAAAEELRAEIGRLREEAVARESQLRERESQLRELRERLATAEEQAWKGAGSSAVLHELKSEDTRGRALALDRPHCLLTAGCPPPAAHPEADGSRLVRSARRCAGYRDR
jgi:uncharacterized protein (DUF3084 family)